MMTMAASNWTTNRKAFVSMFVTRPMRRLKLSASLACTAAEAWETFLREEAQLVR